MIQQKYKVMILNFKKQLKEVNKTILNKKMVMARNI